MAKHRIKKAEKAIIKAAAMKASNRKNVRLDVLVRASSTGQEDYNVLRLVDNVDQSDIHYWGRFNKDGFEFANGAAQLDIAVHSLESRDHEELMTHIQPVWENNILVRVLEGNRVIWSL